MSQFLRGDRKGWRYEFEYRGERYTGSGYETKKAARTAENERRLDVETKAARSTSKGDLTVKDYFELWMADHVKVNCRPRTARLYRQSLETHVLPALGLTPLVELTRPQLKARFAALRSAGLAGPTINNVLIPLRAMLNTAVEDDFIETNPAASLGRRIGRPQTEKEAAHVQAYTKEELAQILEAAEQPYKLAFRALAGAGLRLGELLGLQLGDIHGDHLWVKRSVQWLGAEPLVLAPKSGAVRRVDVTPYLATALCARPGLWVFGETEPWRPERVRKAWYATLDSILGPAAPRRLRLHDLRHTYAATLLQAGAPPSYVKEQLGHSSIQLTVDVYGHLIPGTNRQWVDSTLGGV